MPISQAPFAALITALCTVFKKNRSSSRLACCSSYLRRTHAFTNSDALCSCCSMCTAVSHARATGVGAACCTFLKVP